MRVLLLEDEPRLSMAYARRLRTEGMAVDETRTLHEARLAISEIDYDCLVLDRFVPDGDSLDLVDELHRQSFPPPVVVVSAAGQCDQRIKGLGAGANDYLPKPVRLDELALRVRRVVVRASGAPLIIRLGRVTLDRARRLVTIDGVEVALSPTQYSVFAYLMVHRERMVPVEELLDRCWNAERDLFASPLPSQITRLRRIFRGALRVVMVHSTGYYLEVDDPHQG